jgi:NTE family protein
LKYALALAGGGTKGSYQMGVWKALRELGIEIEVVSGTSIGAINGVAIALDEYEKARKLWINMDYSQVFQYPKISSVRGAQKKYESIKEQIIDIAKKRGMDITPLREMLTDFIDEDRLRNSPVDLIIVTVSVSDMKPIFIKAKDIPKGQIVDYVLASAALPIFQRIEIDGKTYIDGGAYDVFPVNTLIERGYKNIIAVDLAHTMGIKRKIRDEGANVIYIRNSSSVGWVLEFDRKLARRNLRLGYLDTMKAFGKNYGKRYFIKDSRKLRYTYDLTEDEMGRIFKSIEAEEESGMLASVLTWRLLKNLRKYTTGNLDAANAFLAAMEIAAETLEIDRIREYSREALARKIIKTYDMLMRGKGPGKNGSSRERFKMEVSKRLIKDDQLPSPMLLLTLPKIYITQLFIVIMKQRMNEKAKSDSVGVKKELYRGETDGNT